MSICNESNEKTGGNPVGYLGRGKCWRVDVAVLWVDGVRYYANLWWTMDEAGLVARAWDREAPVRMAPVPRWWVTQFLWGNEGGVAMAFLKRAVAGEGEKRVSASKEATTWATKHPALYEYMTSVTYPDGGQRKTSTLLLFWEDGIWKGCLKDRDAGRSLWVTAGSPQEVLSDLEATLQSDVAEWRKDKDWTPPGKKR